MKVIGLTGGSGAGKSTAAQAFSALGAVIIDADEVCRGIYTGDCLDEVRMAFGDGVISSDGTLVRSSLRDIVFSDREALDRLNSIVHKYIAKAMDDKIDMERAKNTPAVILDAPQLFEAGMQDRCDVIVAVIAPESDRVERICSRDGISELQARERISMQYTDDFFKEKCDYLIFNPKHKNISDDVKSIYNHILKIEEDENGKG